MITPKKFGELINTGKFSFVYGNEDKKDKKVSNTLMTSYNGNVGFMKRDYNSQKFVSKLHLDSNKSYIFMFEHGKYYAVEITEFINVNAFLENYKQHGVSQF